MALSVPETFEWLRERSERLEAVEAQLAEARRALEAMLLTHGCRDNDHQCLLCKDARAALAKLETPDRSG